MLLMILAVAPVLALLLVMAAQPLFEMWDARASDRAARAGSTDAAGDRSTVPEPAVLPEPAVYPESLCQVAAAVRIPEQCRPLPAHRAPAAG